MNGISQLLDNGLIRFATSAAQIPITLLTYDSKHLGPILRIPVDCVTSIAKIHFYWLAMAPLAYYSSERTSMPFKAALLVPPAIAAALYSNNSQQEGNFEHETTLIIHCGTISLIFAAYRNFPYENFRDLSQDLRTLPGRTFERAKRLFFKTPNSTQQFQGWDWSNGIPEALEDDCVFKRHRCPISYAPIVDPVLDPTNHCTIYDRQSYVRLLESDHPCSVATSDPLDQPLIELPCVKDLIEDRIAFHRPFLARYEKDPELLEYQLSQRPPKHLLAAAEQELDDLKKTAPQRYTQEEIREINETYGLIGRDFGDVCIANKEKEFFSGHLLSMEKRHPDLSRTSEEIYELLQRAPLSFIDIVQIAELAEKLPQIIVEEIFDLPLNDIKKLVIEHMLLGGYSKSPAFIKYREAFYLLNILERLAHSRFLASFAHLRRPKQHTRPNCIQLAPFEELHRDAVTYLKRQQAAEEREPNPENDQANENG